MDSSRKKQLRRQYKANELDADRRTLGITREQLDDLLVYLDRTLVECDRSLTHALRWAEQEGLDVGSFEDGLLELGGNCDCMVQMNFKPTRFGWPGHGQAGPQA